MIIYNLSNIVLKFEGDVHIVSYLKDEYVSNYQDIEERVTRLPGVDMVAYHSKEEALEKFKESLGNEERFLDDIPVNPLPASLEIRLKDEFKNKAGVDEVLATLEAMGVFDDIAYGLEWIENFHKFLNMLKFISIAIGGIFLLAAIFIISNTIKLAIYSRREEIRILRLVGATDGFIRAPFFIEGVMQGFCGGVISIGALYILHMIFLAKVKTLSFIGINSQSMPFLPLKFLFIIVVFSAIIGLAGSFVSLSEIMKE